MSPQFQALGIRPAYRDIPRDDNGTLNHPCFDACLMHTLLCAACPTLAGC